MRPLLLTMIIIVGLLTLSGCRVSSRDLSEGFEQIEAGSVDAAFETFQSAWLIAPNNSEVQRGMGLVLAMHNSSLSAAIELLEQALHNRRHQQSEEELLQIYLELALFDRARSFFGLDRLSIDRDFAAEQQLIYQAIDCLSADERPAVKRRALEALRRSPTSESLRMSHDYLLARCITERHIGSVAETQSSQLSEEQALLLNEAISLYNRLPDRKQCWLATLWEGELRDRLAEQIVMLEGSGDAAAVEQLKGELDRQRFECRVDHAGSPMIQRAHSRYLSRLRTAPTGTAELAAERSSGQQRALFESEQELPPYDVILNESPSQDMRQGRLRITY